MNIRRSKLALMCVSATVLVSSTLSVNAQVASSPAKKPAQNTEVKNGYNLAFVDADARRVIDAILGSMLGYDYSIDPTVQGNLTLRTNQPVLREALLPMLEAALKSVNAVIIVDGRSYKVVPRSEAKARAPIVATDVSAATSGYASEVIALKFGSAKEIARLLEQFLGKDIVAGSDNARSQIVITGSGEERQGARALIERFDVDTLVDMNFQIYRLENIDADTILAELEQIFKPPFDIIGSRVRIIPLQRLRSVLAIAADRSDLGRIEPWIKRLDTGVSGKRKLYSYAVQHGRARDLASALQQVLGGSGSPADSTATAASAAPATNSGRTAGEGTPDGGNGGIGDRATEAVPSQTSVIANGVRIVPSESTNSLLIYADGEEYQFIKDAMEKIDQPVAQVLIEATLAEVTLSNDLRYGINFRGLSGNTAISNSATNNGVPSSVFPGFSLSVIGRDVNGILNTLQSKTNVRVLSAPKLIVLNNQTATLQVGDQVPIISQQQQSVSSPGAPVVNTVELRDTGVILKVTPRVNESGTVTLEIDQEVSDVAQTTTSGINSPTIQQRRLSSTVATRTGQMVALGGLIRERSTRSKSGIPLLSQIPFIGGVFGQQLTTGSRTELIILLTPTVIRSPNEVKGIVDSLIDGLDAARPLVEQAKARQVGGRTTQP
jgi:general secretion pathway protein D